MGIPTRTDCINIFWLGRYTARSLETLTLGLEVVRWSARELPWQKAYDGLLGNLPLAQDVLPWFFDTVVRQEQPPGIRFALRMAREDALCLRGLVGTKAITLVNLALQEVMTFPDSNLLLASQRILAFGNGLFFCVKERLGEEKAWVLELGRAVEVLDVRLRVRDLKGALQGTSRINALLKENGVALAPLEDLRLQSLEEKVCAFEHMLSV